MAKTNQRKNEVCTRTRGSGVTWRKLEFVLAAGIFASEFGGAPWTKERVWVAVRAIYRRSRAALASVSETTDSLVRNIRKVLTAGRFPRLGEGRTMKPEDAGRALCVTRKLVTHGLSYLSVLAQLKRLIGPRASARRGRRSSFVKQVTIEGKRYVVCRNEEEARRTARTARRSSPRSTSN